MHRFNMCEMLRLALLLICLIYIARTHAEDVNGASASEDRSLLSSDVGKQSASLFDVQLHHPNTFSPHFSLSCLILELPNPKKKCVHHRKCVFLENQKKQTLFKSH